jgi:HPt (histidine-containing phosphotransfer) domain-containing protein
MAIEGERERCLGAGMDDYLAKPVRPVDLFAKLQQWLGGEPAPVPAPAPAQPASRMGEQLDAFIGELKEIQTAREDIDALLQIVLESTPPVMLRLAESIQRREEQPACFAAHSLKGSFATIGLSDLSKVVASVEVDCKDRLWQKAEDEMATVKRLFGEVQELITARIGLPVAAD